MATLDAMSGLWSNPSTNEAVSSGGTNNPRTQMGTIGRTGKRGLSRSSERSSIADISSNNSTSRRGSYSSYNGTRFSDKLHENGLPLSSDLSDCESYNGTGSLYRQLRPRCQTSMSLQTTMTPNNGHAAGKLYESDDSGTIATTKERKTIMMHYTNGAIQARGGAYVSDESGSSTCSKSLGFIAATTSTSSSNGIGSDVSLKKKVPPYDSDDSGTVCGDDTSSDDGGGGGISRFQERFAHLFITALPPPLKREVTHFSYMSVRNSKRRAPLPPSLPPSLPPAHPPGQPRVRSRTSLKVPSSSTIRIRSKSGSTSYRKSLKRRLSLATLFPSSSRLSLSNKSEHLTQTAPATIQSLSLSGQPYDEADSITGVSSWSTLDTSSQDLYKYNSSMGSSCSNGSFSSFKSSSSSLSRGSSGSYLMVEQKFQENGNVDGNYRLVSSYDYSSSSSFTASSSSWDTSSLSSLQTVASRNATKKDERFSEVLVPPVIPYNNSVKSMDRGIGRKAPSTNNSGIKVNVKPTKSFDLMKSSEDWKNILKRNRSSSEGCVLDDGAIKSYTPLKNNHRGNNVLCDDVNGTNKYTSSRRQKFRNSIRSKTLLPKGKADGMRIHGSSNKSSLRSWFSNVALKRDADTSSECNDVLVKCDELQISPYEGPRSEMYSCTGGLTKSRSEVALNRMLDDVNLEDLDDCTPNPPPKLSKSKLSRSMNELRLFTRVNMISQDIVKKNPLNLDDDEWYLKTTRIIVLPPDIGFEEPPIYENVTCVIKPKPPAKPQIMRAKEPLPPRQRPKLNFDQFVADGRSKTFNRIIEEPNSLSSNLETENGFKSADGDGKKKMDDSVFENNQRRTLIDKDSAHSEEILLRKADWCSTPSLLTDTSCSDNLPTQPTENKFTPTRVDLRNLNTSNKWQDSSSQPASPSPFKKSAAPRLGGTVKDLIQRFSSMDNVSNMHNTLPNRTPRKGLYVKQKMALRNVLSHDLEQSRHDEKDMKFKFSTWDKNVSKEFRKSLSSTREYYEGGECIAHDGQNNTPKLTVSPTVDMSITPNSIPARSKVNKITPYKEGSNVPVVPSVDRGGDAKFPAEDSPFTAMIKESRVLKSVRGSHDDDLVQSTNCSTSTKLRRDQEEDTIGSRIQSEMRTDSLGRNSKQPQHRRLSLSTRLDHAFSSYPRNEMTDENPIHRSLDCLTDDIKSESFAGAGETPRYASINKSLISNRPHNTDEYHVMVHTDPKKSPFQKFKESLLGSINHSASNKVSRNLNYETEFYSSVEHENPPETEKRSTKSYIQLKSLRTWKDVKKNSMDSRSSSISESSDFSSSFSIYSKPLSAQSSPSFARIRSNSISVISSEFSSNCSSERSSPEPAHDQGVANNLNPSKDNYSVCLDSTRNQSWKFDPICYRECNSFMTHERYSSIHDLDRSITYVSHKPTNVHCPDPIVEHQGRERHMYSSRVFKNPMRYLKQSQYSRNFGHSSSHCDAFVDVPKPRRHSLSNFSPEVLNNEYETVKKFTPSSLYPITLSPTPPPSSSNIPCGVDWTRRRNLPPPPSHPPPPPPPLQGRPHLSLSKSVSLPFASPPPPPTPLPSHAPSSLSYSPNGRQHPPYFCTRNLGVGYQATAQFSSLAEEMPPPVRFSGIKRNRSFLHSAASENREAVT